MSCLVLIGVFTVLSLPDRLLIPGSGSLCSLHGSIHGRPLASADSLQRVGPSSLSGQLDKCGGSVSVTSGGSLLVHLAWLCCCLVSVRVQHRLFQSRIPPKFFIPSRHPATMKIFIPIPPYQTHVALAHR